MERKAESASPAVALSSPDEARVVRIQKLIRGRLARKQSETRAGELYRKCWDALSGFKYYYNLRTGVSMWQEPTLLGASDADWVEPATSAADFEAAALAGADEATRDDPSRVEKDPFPRLKLMPEPPKTAANMAQWK